MHWPFCLAKCPYCDFNSHVRHGGIEEERFLAAYLTELDTFRGLRAGAHRLQHLLRRRHAVADGSADGHGDPRSHRRALERRSQMLRSRSKPIRPASRRRASQAMRRPASIDSRLGVQALDDQSLKALGRMHTADEALAALDLAKRNFGRVSFDLIYAREGQSVEQWRSELTEALAPCRRSSLALSAHHRARHDVRRAA